MLGALLGLAIGGGAGMVAVKLMSAATEGMMEKADVIRKLRIIGCKLVDEAEAAGERADIVADVAVKMIDAFEGGRL